MNTHRLSKKVALTLERLIPAYRGTSLGIAVSGGPDSVALGAVLVGLASSCGFRVHVLHVNHGLRPEADDEQSFVESLCQRWNVSCTVERLLPPTPRNGIEVWAREARYKFFRRVRIEEQLIAVALAHTQDDQAETVLFRCLRGSVGRGLAGIPPIRNGWIIRPLLECTRQEVMQYLTAQKLPFVTDASNTDLRFTRNKIRHELLPLLERDFSPRIREHLVQMATVFREEEEWLETLTTAARNRIQESPLVLSLPRLTIEPPALQMRVLRQWIGSNSAVHDLTARHFQCLRTLISGRSRVSVALPGKMLVRREGTHLVLEEKNYERQHLSARVPYVYTLTPGAEVDIPQGGWTVRVSSPFVWDSSPESARSGDLWQAVFDLNEGASLILARNFRVGDRITPLGLGGTKKVHDVFIDAKVPHMLRSSLPLITIGDQIAWVPGCTRGEIAKVSGTTRRVCRVEVIPLPEK